VYAKFFFPAADWTWFVTEGEDEGDDFVFFGFVKGFEEEWCYFTLNELQDINVEHLTVERDLYFKPGKIENILEYQVKVYPELFGFTNKFKSIYK
jgi:hypothetical protein